MTGQMAVALDADGGLIPLLRFQLWDQVIAYPKIDGGVGELEWRIAQVAALTAKKRPREARQHRQAFASQARALPGATTWWGDPIAKFLPMAEAEMDARLAWADGSRGPSIQFWRRAV